MRLRDDANDSAEQLLDRINRAEEAQHKETLRQDELRRGFCNLNWDHFSDLLPPEAIQGMREQREAFTNQAAAQQRVLDQHDDLYTLQGKVQLLKKELNENEEDLERAETPPPAVIQSLPKNDQLANSVA